MTEEERRDLYSEARRMHHSLTTLGLPDAAATVEKLMKAIAEDAAEQAYYAAKAWRTEFREWFDALPEAVDV